jgi:hypothetical protein
VIAYARGRNLRRVYGHVLADNAGMLQMSAELGFRAVDWGPDFKRVILELQEAG